MAPGCKEQGASPHQSRGARAAATGAEAGGGWRCENGRGGAGARAVDCLPRPDQWWLEAPVKTHPSVSLLEGIPRSRSHRYKPSPGLCSRSASVAHRPTPRRCGLLLQEGHRNAATFRNIAYFCTGRFRRLCIPRPRSHNSISCGLARAQPFGTTTRPS
jgi:hypothetical protein